MTGVIGVRHMRLGVVSKAAIAIVLVGAGIFNIPSDKVSKNYEIRCSVPPIKIESRKTTAEERLAKIREEVKNLPAGKYNVFDLLSDDEIRRYNTEDLHYVTKSGLRQSIEGRLQWMGLPNFVSYFDKNCEDFE